MQQLSISFLAAFTILTLIATGTARDLRDVTEPRTPRVCTSLNATGGDDIEIIQKALNTCTKGEAVSLASGTFYSGPLTIPSGVGLLVDLGVTLKAIPNPKLYDLGAKTCGTVDDYGVGCKALITILEASDSGVYGRGTIDGQGGEKMTGTNMTWWRLSKIAQLKGKHQNNPRLIQITKSSNITVYQIRLINSPLFHVASNETNGLTVWGITIYSPRATVNTDGVNPDGSQNVTIAHCNITTIGEDIGISGVSAPSRHISVHNINFNRGDGVAIGSRVDHGVSHVSFSNMTMDILENGLYIKSSTLYGGLVANITYNHICLYRVRNPINFDMFYHNLTGTRTTQYKDITFNNVQVGSSGSFIFNGVDKADPIEVKMNDVHIAKGSAWSITNAEVTGNWKYDIREMHCAHGINN